MAAYGRAMYLYVDHESWRRFEGATLEVEYSAEERQQLERKADVVTRRRCFWSGVDMRGTGSGRSS